MFKDRLIDFYYDTREFLRRNKKVVMPLFLLLCVLITAGLACTHAADTLFKIRFFTAKTDKGKGTGGSVPCRNGGNPGGGSGAGIKCI